MDKSTVIMSRFWLLTLWRQVGRIMLTTERNSSANKEEAPIIIRVCPNMPQAPGFRKGLSLTQAEGTRGQ